MVCFFFFFAPLGGGGAFDWLVVFFFLPIRIPFIFFSRSVLICLSKNNCSTYGNEKEIFLTEDSNQEGKCYESHFMQFCSYCPFSKIAAT